MNDSKEARNQRILVIDDNPAIHDDFRKILGARQEADQELEAMEAVFFEPTATTATRQSFEIDCALQGDEGLRLVEKSIAEGRPYALAFVDIRMPPGWDGVETISQIWRICPELQVVICTAYSDYSWEQINGSLGQSDNLLILKKPFDNVEVQQLAHALTEKWFLNNLVRSQLTDLDRAVNARTLELRMMNAELQKRVLEKTLAESALRLSEQRFSKAFSASPMPMAIQTLEEERYLDVNTSFLAMIGYCHAELMGHTAAELKLWQDENRRAQVQELVRNLGSVRDLECKFRTKAGKVRSVLLSIELFDVGVEPHMLVIAQDVSEHLALEEQFRQAQKLEAVGQLASGVAHDFNNILTIIQGHVGLQMHRKDLDKSLEGSLRQIGAASDRAAGLTRQLMTFSRKQLIRPTLIDLNALLASIRNMLGRLISEGVTQSYDLSSRPPKLVADENTLVQVVINLAVNARDAMPNGGTLTFRTSFVDLEEKQAARHVDACAGSFICLSVTDTGCGMDESVRSRIFEPFFTTKEVGKGTGLGLATVYGIVKQHKGWIEVESEVGKGTSFHVFLPASAVGESTGERNDTVQPVQGGKETILLVEDDTPVRALARAILLGGGYKVLEAENGQAALRIWHESASSIDLVFTDMVMPHGLSGGALAQALRRMRPDLKVIFTTGYSEEASAMGRQSEFRAGLNYLQKPYDADKLLRIVRNCLDTPAHVPAHAA